MNDRMLVQAICIDYNYIYTICCNTNCSDHIHKYGSDANTLNRLEYRCSHCPAYNKEICIRIDDTTKRCKLNYYNNKSITLSTRAFNKQLKNIKNKIDCIKIKTNYNHQKKELVLSTGNPYKVFFD